MTESAARAERVNLQSASAPAYTWEAPEKPVSVQLPLALIDRLEREVVENFRSLTSRGSEIGGILLGTATPGSPFRVYIDDFELIECDYSRGPLYRFSDADMGRFERAIEQRAAGGFRVAGFFRSHTRKGLSLDAEDLAFFCARFRDPSHVALLVRPYASKASTAGFFLWEGGAVQGEASALEFPFRSSQLTGARPPASAEAAVPAPPVNSAGPASAAAPAPAPPKPAVRAQIVPIASRREITLPLPPEPPVSEPAAARGAETKPAEDRLVPPAAAAPNEAHAQNAAVAPAEAAPQAKVAEPPKEKAAEPPAAPAKEPAKEPAKAPVVEKAAVPPAVPEKAAAPPPIEDPATQKSSAHGKTVMVAVLAAAALLAGVVLFLYPGVLRHGKAPALTQEDAPSLSLRVERTGADILLTWNRDSAAIQHAKHALLTISDGDRHENYDMDLNQLRNGSIVYSPLTADVSFRMDVTAQGNGRNSSESVRVLRTRPSPMPDGSAPLPDAAAKTTARSVEPAADAAAATSDTGEEQQPAAPKAGTPARPFNTASLAQRLRPATPADIPLPAAPALNNNPSSPAPLPSIAGSVSAPAPFVPPPAPAPPAAPRKAPLSGGQIVQAQLIYSKQPEYPKLARQMGVKGSVELVATIGVDGHVKKVKVEKGHPLLTKAASDAVMQWVYKPTLLNGTPVENDTHITLNFLGDR